MAVIPTTSPMGAPSNPTMTPQPITTTDLGLSSVAHDLGKVADAYDARAKTDAVRAYQDVQTGYAGSYDPAAANYDGQEPGFAARQVADYDARVAAARAGLPHDARVHFEQMASAGRVQAFDSAVSVEAQKSAARTKQAQDQVARVSAMQVYGAVLGGFAKDKAALVDGYDGSDPHFADKVQGLYDRHVEVAMADIEDPEVRSRAELMFADQRVDVVTQASAMEGKARGAYVVNGVLTASDMLSNAVLSDPGQYNAAFGKVDRLIAELPGAVQDKYRGELHDRLAMSRFQGLIEAGGRDQALEEVKSGHYDAVLTPEHKASLLRTLSAERDGEARAVTAEILGQKMEAEIASVGATGTTTGLAVDQVRAALGPAKALEFAAKLDHARATYQATTGMEGLPRGDIMTRLAGLQPAAGDPDFANKNDAYQRAVAAADKAIKLQSTDPARAAASNPDVQGAYRAFVAQPSPQSAKAYGDATLALQARMGLEPNERRVLPLADAKAMIKPLVSGAPGTTAKGMEQLGAAVGAFGPYAGQALRELRQAGLSPAAQAVLVSAGDDPVAIGAYAHGLESNKLDAAQSKNVHSLVADRLAGMQRTLLPLAGGADLSRGMASAVEIAARGYIANGDEPGDAVKKAVAPYVGQYAFRNTWRMPSALAARQVVVPTHAGGALSGLPDQVKVTSADAVALGARRTLAEIVGVKPPAYDNNPLHQLPFGIGPVVAFHDRENTAVQGHTGKGLAAAGVDGEALDTAQKRARYADMVAERGQWATTQDDSGLILVLPVRTGQFQPVLGADGKPVVRTWDQLIARAKH